MHESIKLYTLTIDRVSSEEVKVEVISLLKFDVALI